MPLAVEAVAADRPEVALRGPAGPRPASPGSAGRSPGPGRRRRRGRWRSGRAAAGRCRRSGSPRTRASRASRCARRSSISRAVSVSRTWLAGRSPLSRRRYSWTPSRPNAQARGEVISRIAGRASSKSCGGPGLAGRAAATGRRRRPAPRGPGPGSPPSRPPPASGGRSS